MTTDPPTTSFHPAESALDDVELLKTGVLSAATANVLVQRLASTLPAVPSSTEWVELEDEESVPVARIAVDGSRFEGMRPRSPRPFDRRNVLARGRNSLAGHRVAVIDALPASDDVEAVRVASDPVTVLVLAADRPGLGAHGLVRGAIAAFDKVADVAVLHRSTPRDDVDHVVLDELLAALGAESRMQLPNTGTVSSRVRAAATLPTTTGLPGAVVLFTGLSGSGKSTLARGLRDVIVERGIRTISLLDGDVVRRNLSAGLGFDKEDRERNIRRIGWVGAEIARHGGLAICSPIAPFAHTREDVRSMVEHAGGRFVLVHVATSLAECERRDRKGLYAKARAGIIPDFTGISSPYEEPESADLRIDTEGRGLDECLAEIMQVLDSHTLLTSR